MLTSVTLPRRVQTIGEASARGRLLEEFGIEVGAGLGPLAGEIWRIGRRIPTPRNELVQDRVGPAREVARGKPVQFVQPLDSPGMRR